MRKFVCMHKFLCFRMFYLSLFILLNLELQRLHITWYDLLAYFYQCFLCCLISNRNVWQRRIAICLHVFINTKWCIFEVNVARDGVVVELVASDLQIVASIRLATKPVSEASLSQLHAQLATQWFFLELQEIGIAWKEEPVAKSDATESDYVRLCHRRSCANWSWHGLCRHPKRRHPWKRRIGSRGSGAVQRARSGIACVSGRSGHWLLDNMPRRQASQSCNSHIRMKSSSSVIAASARPS